MTSRHIVAVAELTGDHEAARRVGLVLPETGVCSGAGLPDEPDADAGAACGVTPNADLTLTGNAFPR